MVEPLSIAKEVAARWFRTEIDPDELAKLRWEMNWTIQRIAGFLKLPKTCVIKRLSRLGAQYGKTALKINAHRCNR